VVVAQRCVRVLALQPLRLSLILLPANGERRRRCLVVFP
jgi:hypothetical protein